ncbi:LOW QUALITY PROTEIN: hypothetical protein YC2023_101929 [Brassica napus]
MGIAASRQPVCLKQDIDLSMISLHQKSYPRSCSAPRPPESTREPILKLPLSAAPRRHTHPTSPHTNSKIYRPRRASRLRGRCPGELTSLTQARRHQNLHKDGATRRPYSP